MADQMELIDMKNVSKCLVAAVALAAMTTGCASAADSTRPPMGPATKPSSSTDIESAVFSCALKKNPYVSVGDEGTTLVIDGADDYGDYGLGINKIACLTLQLGISDATVARIDSTNSLMGQQSATEDELEVSWTYHPDNGLDMVITEVGEPA